MIWTSTRVLTAPIAIKNNAEIEVPITLPAAAKPGTFSDMNEAATAIAAERAITTVECPSEKNRPALTGRLRSCMSLRVTLSMAAI
jgi:hypothetical protein